MNVSPEPTREDFVTLGTAPVQESRVPARASQPDPTDSSQMCATPSSFVEVSLNDPGLQRHHTQLVTGFRRLIRTYYNIDATGAEVEESWNRPVPPLETPASQPNATPSPEDDVVLSERDQIEYPASGTILYTSAYIIITKP